MHLPMNNLVLGEAAGEGDFAVRLVDVTEDAEPDTDGEARKGHEEIANLERLRFSRRKREDGLVAEKRAWVVSPGKRYMSLDSVKCDADVTQEWVISGW